MTMKARLVALLLCSSLHLYANEVECIGNPDAKHGMALPCIRNTDHAVEEAVSTWGPIIFSSFDKKIVNSDEDLAILRVDDYELNKFHRLFTTKFQKKNFFQDY